MTQEPEEINDGPQPIASRLHLAGFLATQLFLAVISGSLLRRVVAITDPAKFHFYLACYYLLIIALEWALVLYVWFGMRNSQAPIAKLIGGRWASIWDGAKDLLLGLALWLAWIVIATTLAMAYRPEHRGSPYAFAILPRTSIEIILWLTLSASAGFCEEVVYRGYLQRQLLALVKSVPLAVLGQAVLFGLIHRYQGAFSAVVIGIMGTLFGFLAARRKSLRPGIVAHMWHDGLIGVVFFLMNLYR